MDARPRALDLYCCAGGATRGYQFAGFHVTGVDNRPQPHYIGDEFIPADAMDVLRNRDFLARFALIAASPPCQDHSPLSALVGEHRTGWMLHATHDLLMAQPVPSSIKNMATAHCAESLLMALPWAARQCPGPVAARVTCC